MKRGFLLKILLCVLLTSISSFCLVGCSNEDKDNKTNNQSNDIVYSQGLSYELDTETDSYIVTGIGSCKDTNVIIPPIFEGKPVVDIDAWAFTNCSSLISVIVPYSVKEISIYAFMGCSSLTKISISNSVTVIELCSFSNCTSLENIVIPNSVTDIGPQAFEWCTSLSSVTIGNNTTRIGSNAFLGCSSLQYNVKEGLMYLGSSENKYACLISSETNIITANIDSNCKSIAILAFNQCYSLKTVTIPVSITHIDFHTFFGCYSLANITYSGKTNDWKSIEKKENWILDCPATKVVCTDGEVPLTPLN